MDSIQNRIAFKKLAFALIFGTLAHAWTQTAAHRHLEALFFPPTPWIEAGLAARGFDRIDEPEKLRRAYRMHPDHRSGTLRVFMTEDFNWISVAVPGQDLPLYFLKRTATGTGSPQWIDRGSGTTALLGVWNTLDPTTNKTDFEPKTSKTSFKAGKTMAFDPREFRY